MVSEANDMSHQEINENMIIPYKTLQNLISLKTSTTSATLAAPLINPFKWQYSWKLSQSQSDLSVSDNPSWSCGLLQGQSDFHV